MKNILVILYVLLLFINCGSPRKGVTEEKEPVSTSDNREIYHLLLISYPEYGVVKTKLQAFYTDGTVIDYTGNLSKTSIEEINEISPDKSYYKEVDNKLLRYTGDGEFLTEHDLLKKAEVIDPGSSWKRYEWAMIRGKWLIRPEGMRIDEHFEEIPKESDLGLVSVLLDGCCSYDKFEFDITGWYQLSYLPGQKEFEVVPVNLSIGKFYWDCGDMDMYTVISDTKNAVLLFKGLEVDTGMVKSHFHEVTCVVPDAGYSFSFNGVNYTLRAEGILSEYHNTITGEYEISEDGRKETGNVYQEYKLYLESGDISQLILAIDNFSDRYVKVQFIGDIDKDGKPDFIFDTATWYEDYEKMLFLSSFADKGKLVKFAGRDGFSMAC